MPRWLFWMLVTLLSWGLWAILLHEKLATQPVSAAQSQAMSTLGILPILIAVGLIKDESPPRNYRRGVVLAFGSGVISGLGNIGYYAALANSQASTVVPLAALYPAVTILLAIPLLRERVAGLQWLGVAASLVAIYLFLKPAEHHQITGGAALTLIPIVLWGVTLLLQKMSTEDISARSSALWFLAAFVPLGLAIVAYDPVPAGLSARTWALQLAAGFTLALGNLTILLACASGGKASVVAPLSGLYPIVSIPIAIVFLGEAVATRQAAGIALALVAVVLLTYQTDSPVPAPASVGGLEP
jgi:drug/metabolite transporter (DMT)-like permease